MNYVIPSPSNPINIYIYIRFGIKTNIFMDMMNVKIIYENRNLFGSFLYILLRILLLY